MNVVELFAGTCSCSKVARALGHTTFTTDYEEIDGQDLVADIRDLNAKDFPYQPDVLWASPPCEGFSVAAIGKNWTHDHRPKTDSARLGVELVQNAMRLIDELKPTYWFIENPRGKLRKLPFMDEFLRRQGGFGIQFGIVSMEICVQNLLIYGRMHMIGVLDHHAQMGTRLVTTNGHQEDHAQARRVYRGIRIDPVYRRNYSRIYFTI